MSAPKTSTDLRNVTFSQALEDGLTHYDWLIGRNHDRSGQDRVLVSHSVSREKAKEKATSDICGPLFGGSSPSADLQSSLGNRLRQKLDGTGSPEYVLTWKQWDMLWGPQICALRASGRRISGSGFGGWQSPKASDCKSPGKSRDVHLNHQAAMAGWMSPQASDGEGGVMEIREGAKGRYKLRDVAHLAGWLTPATCDGEGGTNLSKGREKMRLRDQAPLMAGWATPRSGKVTDEDPESWAKRNKDGKVATMPLGLQAQMAGWTTPKAVEIDESEEQWRKRRKGKSKSGIPAKTGKPGAYRLNPLFSLWLMGYPAEWGFSGARAMQSCRK